MKTATRAFMLTAIAMLAIACQSRDDIAVRDAFGYAPLAGSGMAVAYLVIDNNTRDDAGISGFTSEQFGHVALHETVERDGVSRMQELTDVTVRAGESLTMEPGGKHLMLMQAQKGLGAGSRIEIVIHWSNGNRQAVQVELLDRMQTQSSRGQE